MESNLKYYLGYVVSNIYAFKNDFFFVQLYDISNFEKRFELLERTQTPVKLLSKFCIFIFWAYQFGLEFLKTKN